MVIFSGGSVCNITHYRKPINRPCPIFDHVISIEEVKPNVTPAVTRSRLKELLYSFGRCSLFYDDLSALGYVSCQHYVWLNKCL